MKSTIVFFLAALVGSMAQAQTLRDAIVSPEKAIPVVHQVLEGTWLSDLRRPGPSGLLPAIPAIVTFSPDGSSISSPADGTQTATQGIWVRVGDRKFLGTGYFFNFDANRVLTTVTKIRINYNVAADGKTLTGTTEAVILDPAGKLIGTFPGTIFSMLRLSPEIPGDFYDFQKLP